MKERENKKLLAKLGNLKTEDIIDQPEPEQNVSLTKKTGRTRGRMMAEREVPRQMMTEDEIVDQPKSNFVLWIKWFLLILLIERVKKKKAEEDTTNLVPNLVAENSTNYNNPSGDKLMLLDSPDPALISPFRSPRLGASGLKQEHPLRLCDSPIPNFFVEDMQNKDHHVPFESELLSTPIADARIDRAEIDSVDSSLHQGTESEQTFL